MLPLEVFMGSTLATLHIHVKRRQKRLTTTFGRVHCAVAEIY